MPPATVFSNEMALLTGNIGGSAQVLPTVNLVGGRKRSFFATIPLTAQAIGTTIGIARIPAGAVITEISLITDTSLGGASICVGDSNNNALYAAATTLTVTETPTRVGKTATTGVAMGANLWDCVTGLANKSYEDVVITVLAAALPGAGTLKATVEYVMD